MVQPGRGWTAGTPRWGNHAVELQATDSSGLFKVPDLRLDTGGVRAVQRDRVVGVVRVGDVVVGRRGLAGLDGGAVRIAQDGRPAASDGRPDKDGRESGAKPQRASRHDVG